MPKFVNEQNKTQCFFKTPNEFGHDFIEAVRMHNSLEDERAEAEYEVNRAKAEMDEDCFTVPVCDDVEQLIADGEIEVHDDDLKPVSEDMLMHILSTYYGVTVQAVIDTEECGMPHKGMLILYTKENVCEPKDKEHIPEAYSEIKKYIDSYNQLVGECINGIDPSDSDELDYALTIKLEKRIKADQIVGRYLSQVDEDDTMTYERWGKQRVFRPANEEYAKADKIMDALVLRELIK